MWVFVGVDVWVIFTLDGMRGLAVLAVLIFHFAWMFSGDDPSQATMFVDKFVV